MKQAFVLPVLLCGLVLMAPDGFSQPRIIEQAELSVGSAVPGPDAEWKQVSLPYVFTPQDYGISREGWFRVPLDNSTDPAPALLFPKVNMNVEVFLNRELIATGGSFDEPVTRNWNRPLLFPVPPELLGRENELLIHLISYRPFGRLGVFRYGEASELRPVYDRIHWNNNVITEIMFYVTFVAGLWGLMLWAQRPRDTINLWYSLSAIAWSLYSLNLFIESIPFSAHVWDAIQFASLDLLAVLVTGFIHRLLGLSRPLLEKCLLGYVWTGLIIELVLDNAAMNAVSNWWHLGAVGLIFYMIFQVVLHYRRLDVQARSALVLFFFSAVIVSIHDLLFQTGSTHVLPWRLFPYPAPILLLFFFWLLVKRFVSAMNEAESLSGELDQRVEANRVELEQSYLELQRAETLQAVEQEREAIRNRFHEEVGGTLQLLAGSGQEKVAEAIAEVMTDLQLTVSNSLPAEGRLTQVLEQWRGYITGRIKPAGIALNWRSRGIADDMVLTRTQHAQLGRILNEAVTNAIKHANAEEISVNWEYGSGEMELRIEDRGRPAKVSVIPGRGVMGMQARARKLGGNIDWYPSSTGCLVLLILPCYHPANIEQPAIP